MRDEGVQQPRALGCRRVNRGDVHMRGQSPGSRDVLAEPRRVAAAGGHDLQDGRVPGSLVSSVSPAVDRLDSVEEAQERGCHALKHFVVRLIIVGLVCTGRCPQPAVDVLEHEHARAGRAQLASPSVSTSRVSARRNNRLR